MVVKVTGPTHEDEPTEQAERTQTLYTVKGIKPVNEAGEVGELTVGVDEAPGAVEEVLTNN